MEKKLINPWAWLGHFGYSQAVEVKNISGTLICSGQAAMLADGTPLEGDMADQIRLSLANLETVASQAGYQIEGLTRLNIYTTSIPEFFAAHGEIQSWMSRHGIAPSSTLIQVSALAFPQLKVEIEATLVR